MSLIARVTTKQQGDMCHQFCAGHVRGRTCIAPDNLSRILYLCWLCKCEEEGPSEILSIYARGLCAVGATVASAYTLQQAFSEILAPGLEATSLVVQYPFASAIVANVKGKELRTRPSPASKIGKSIFTSRSLGQGPNLSQVKTRGKPVQVQSLELGTL